jgi:hypothetical protein
MVTNYYIPQAQLVDAASLHGVLGIPVGQLHSSNHKENGEKILPGQATTKISNIWMPTTRT